MKTHSGEKLLVAIRKSFLRGWKFSNTNIYQLMYFNTIHQFNDPIMSDIVLGAKICHGAVEQNVFLWLLILGSVSSSLRHSDQLLNNLPHLCLQWRTLAQNIA